MICAACGYSQDEMNICPLCNGIWDEWELRLPPVPMQRNKDQIMAWLAQCTPPIFFEIDAQENGTLLRLLTPPGTNRQWILAWASMTHQQSRWVLVREMQNAGTEKNSLALHVQGVLPHLTIGEAVNTDPLIAIAGQLGNQKSALRIWILGNDTNLQEKLKALSAYSYGTEAGVGNDAPNPWGIRLTMLRAIIIVGILTAGIFGGLTGGGAIRQEAGILGIVAGGILAIAGAVGMINWMSWRSIPKEIVETRLREPLLKVAFSYQGNGRPPALVGGSFTWDAIKSEWPAIVSKAFPLPAGEIASIVSPPETGNVGGIFARETIQDIPSPPPAKPLLDAPLKIGIAAATGEEIGVDPDGHGLAVGGSRTGKSSIMYGLLKQIVEREDDAPGLFLVDPHLSLADNLLSYIDDLPPDKRQKAIQRLRIITPDEPEVIPLNLLAIPDFSWAGNSIVQLGRRIWEDYWGPRMQAALLALFRIAHAWNQNHPDQRLGLIHTVFAAFNNDWRHDALQYLPPAERMGALALDALLGQFGGDGKKWDQGWVTEVISPVLSKVMALELSPWLFSAMHQNSFVDLTSWIQQKAWVIMRLPSGQMGREGARLTAGVVYNVFDAAYRLATSKEAIPYYFVIDEAQEIAVGMRLESMLSEGAKFGARMFVLVQSLSMMKQVEGFEPVVQSLLANTSTQSFFSPDPEDALLVRETLTSAERFGISTLDIPSLHCWLRARIGGQWQPPTLAKIEPLQPVDHKKVKRVIREVIETHPTDYVWGDKWQDMAVTALKSMIANPTYQGYLSELFSGGKGPTVPREGEYEAMSSSSDDRNLGL